MFLKAIEPPYEDYEDNSLEVEILYTVYEDNVLDVDFEYMHCLPDDSDSSDIKFSPCLSSNTSRESSPQPSAPPYMEDLFECLLDKFRNIKSNDPVLPVLAQKGHSTQPRECSWISNSIEDFQQDNEYYSLLFNAMLRLTPYASMKHLPDRDDIDCVLLNQFRYVAMAGVYWAGLKACSGNALTLDDILPFRIVRRAEGPLGPNHLRIVVDGGREIIIKKTGSCPSRVGIAKNSRVFEWAMEKIARFWHNGGACEKQHKVNIKRCMRVSRNYVVATMLGMFTSTDVMLINIPQSQLSISVDRLYRNWHKLYKAGLSLNSRLHTSEPETFNSKDMALYADYIVRGNHFTKIIRTYPDVGVFIDKYFDYRSQSA